MPEYIVTSGTARVRLEAPSPRAALESVLANPPKGCTLAVVAAVKHLRGDPHERKGGVVYFSVEAIIGALGLWASDEACAAAAVACPADAPVAFSEIDRELDAILERWSTERAAR